MSQPPIPREEYEIVAYPRLNHVRASIVRIVSRNTHVHRALELGLVLEGNATVRVDEREFSVGKGAVFFFNTNEPHQIQASSQAGVKIAYLQVASSFCSEYLPCFRNLELLENNLSGALTPEQMQELTKLLMQALQSYLAEDSDLYALHCVHSICGLYSFLLSKVPYRQMTEAAYLARNKKMARLSRITEYIDNNYSEKITLAQLAEQEDVTTTYLSHFIHDHLQSHSFENEGTVYIDIDSFWDFGFRPDQHKIFVEHCHKNGQKAGIYWCPFTDWGGNAKGRVVRDMDYRWEDVYIRAKGEPVRFDGGLAIDPTHPAVRRRIELQIKQFLEWGYEYVKLDFMAHGAYQSDSYYDKSVTTAMQAYNQGMQYIVEQCEGKMWINLSIAPLFPGNYAHSRRISCDAWADIKNTEYVLNSLTYGWWLDHIYHYNDGDHIVYKDVSEGENRARVTSSAITGIYFLGDDMSKGGSPEVKAKVVRSTTNPGINEIARTCPSFRPVEVARGDRGADMFYHRGEKYLYVAMFNYSPRKATKHLELQRLGLSADKSYNAVELWSGGKVQFKGEIAATIPAKDVVVYRIDIK